MGIFSPICVEQKLFGQAYMYLYRKGTSIRQAPVFRHLSITEKPMEVYFLDEWIIITLYVTGFLHPVIYSITVLTNEVWKLLIALLGVMIFRFKKLPFPFGKIVNSVSKGFLNGNSVWP